MQVKEDTVDNGDRSRRESQGKAHPKRKRVFGLQARTIFWYLLVAVLYALVLELLVASGWYVFLTHSPASLKDFQKTGQVPTYLFIVQHVLFTSIIWIILVTPPSLIFGVLVTRGLVRRVRRLVDATTSFAEGDYSQRVEVRSSDEVGLLEERFNHMAQQLVESMRKEQELIEYNTRLEERARIEQEMQTARQIQLSLLPKEVPSLPGWRLATYYQPAREVGGDLYDFLTFADGRLGLVIGDVTDKGVPAALVMATTCSMLRAAALASDSPGDVLAQVNNLLYAETPERMFVTCFYAILEPASGKMRYANAGHDLPYQRTCGKVVELRASGMPLGLLPNMYYEEGEVQISHGDSLLFYSDGLVEAHNAQREMLGFPRLQALLTENTDGKSLIDRLLSDLKDFTGEGWEQEDDVTLMTLQRTGELEMMNEQQAPLQLLWESTMASSLGNEQQAMERMAEVVRPLRLPASRLADLKTAVAEAMLNAMEHGNQFQADKLVLLQVRASPTTLQVRIRDEGGQQRLPDLDTVAAPDLEAKLTGLQSPRGWGLFLIRNLVDEVHIRGDEQYHEIELIMYLQAPGPASRPTTEQDQDMTPT